MIVAADDAAVAHDDADESSLFRLFRSVPPLWNKQNACKWLFLKEFF
jgi:hypothetical protein